jgi:hypothetical protein
VAEKEYEWHLDEVVASELLWCAAYIDRICISPEKPDSSSEDEEDIGISDDDNETTVAEETTTSPQDQEIVEEPYQPVYPGQLPNPLVRSDLDIEQQATSSDGRASPIRVPVPFPLPNLLS